MVLGLDLQLLVIVLKMCVQLCTSVPSLLTCWVGQFITVTDAQGFQRTTASVNNGTWGGVCLFRALSSMLANGKRKPVQVFWEAGWGKRDGCKVQALGALKGMQQETWKRFSHHRKSVLLSCLTVIPPPYLFPCRMSPGASSTLTPSSKPWATCCALGTVPERPSACRTCGSPCWVWLWGPHATPCLSVTPLLSSNHWTPHEGSTKKRWVSSIRCGCQGWFLCMVCFGGFFLTIKLWNSLKLILDNWAIVVHNIWAWLEKRISTQADHTRSKGEWVCDMTGRSPLCTSRVKKHYALFVFTILTSLLLFAYFLHKSVIIQHFGPATICEPTQGFQEHAAVTDQEPEFRCRILVFCTHCFQTVF